jgi:hypothetical protein
VRPGFIEAQGPKVPPRHGRLAACGLETAYLPSVPLTVREGSMVVADILPQPVRGGYEKVRPSVTSYRLDRQHFSALEDLGSIS